MIVTKKIKAYELTAGDVLRVDVMDRFGVEVARIERTCKGKILAFNHYSRGHSIFGHALDPNQWVTILVEGEPDPAVGLFEI